MVKLLSSEVWKRGLVNCFGVRTKPTENSLVLEHSFLKKSKYERREAALAIAQGIQFLAPTKNLGDLFPGGDIAEVVMLPSNSQPQMGNARTRIIDSRSNRSDVAAQIGCRVWYISRWFNSSNRLQYVTQWQSCHGRHRSINSVDT